jgi:hypothetical protein
MQSRFKVLMVSTFVTALCSCGPEVVPSSGPRPPTSPDSVKIYQNKPSKYEDLGLLTLAITPDLGWDRNGDANAAFDRMKEQAAALGANGLLLDVDPSHYDILTQAGYHATFYQVPMKAKTAFGEAIFVLKE